MGLHKHLPFPTSVVTTLILVTCWCHTATTYYCNKQFCSVETAGYNNPCERQNCSTIGFRQFLDPGKCNCCQYCFHYLKLNDTCDKVSPQKPSEMCGPHLTCEEGEKPSDPATCQKSSKFLFLKSNISKVTNISRLPLTYFVVKNINVSDFF